MSQQNNDLKNFLITVILCAGEGVRFKEITYNIPKPLIKINALNKKSILHNTIDLLISLNVKRIAIVKGYLANKIDEFIEKLIHENTNLKEKLFLVDASKEYKLGPLYSFLSITKNKNLLHPKYIYLIIPGDTIFQYQLLNEIFLLIKENFKGIQKQPLIFFREIEAIFLKKENQSKIISTISIDKGKTQKLLKKITRVHLSNITNSLHINQIIPIFLFPHNFIQEIIKIEKKISIKTIREGVNYLIRRGKKIPVCKIESNYNFYDIDTKLDLIEFEESR